MERRNKGITLIALVVTIVVLLILAGISIAMLTGENGVISQAKNAKETTEQARVEELVTVAIGSVISKNNGSTAGITPKMVADQINEDERRSDVYAENETTFPTDIIFPKEKRKAEANLNSGKIADEANAIYDEDINEADIAPTNIFDYEIINDGTTGSLTLDELPTKTVRITRIKPEYCNFEGHNSDTQKKDYVDTNYEIVYNGTKLSDSLIIPYQVDGKYIPNGLEGEFYKVTEVSLAIAQLDIFGYEHTFASIPNVKKIVYPNTVEKILEGGYGVSESNPITQFVFSNKIKEIPDWFFQYCKITSITIPKSITKIGTGAFWKCGNLKTVNYTGTEEEWEKIIIDNCNDDLINATINYNYKK